MFNRFRSALLAATLLTAIAAVPAQAVGPVESVVSTPAKFATYSATITGLVPAASATDFFTIKGSATALVSVRQIGCTGTSTAAGSLPVSLILRSTANTTGTSTAPAGVPLDSNDPAATAVVAAYTVNPGALGTAIGTIDNGLLATVVAASSGTNGLIFSQTDDTRKHPRLRGVTQTLALNAGAASFTAGTSLSCKVQWTESLGQ